MEKIELTELEKAALREAAQRSNVSQEILRQATDDVKRRTAHFEGTVGTIVRLRGLDVNRYQLSFDVTKDIWELHELPQPEAPPVPPSDLVASNGTEPVPAPDGGVLTGSMPGEKPGDIKAIIGMAKMAKELDGPSE